MLGRLVAALTASFQVGVVAEDILAQIDLIEGRTRHQAAAWAASGRVLNRQAPSMQLPLLPPRDARCCKLKPATTRNTPACLDVVQTRG
jgi:hypothetical protein